MTRIFYRQPQPSITYFSSLVTRKVILKSKLLSSMKPIASTNSLLVSGAQDKTNEVENVAIDEFLYQAQVQKKFLNLLTEDLVLNYFKRQVIVFIQLCYSLCEDLIFCAFIYLNWQDQLRLLESVVSFKLKKMKITYFILRTPQAHIPILF